LKKELGLIAGGGRQCCEERLNFYREDVAVEGNKRENTKVFVKQ